MRVFFTGVVVGLFLSTGAYASLEVCGRTLHAVYLDRSFYTPIECCKNVWRLAKQLEKDGLDLSEARVVFILYEYRKFYPDTSLVRAASLFPAKNRMGTDNWDYHVVLEYRGKFLDLDNLSEPIEARKYFGEVFPDFFEPNPEYNLVNRPQTIYGRAVPAREFVNQIQDAQQWAMLAEKYRDETNPNLPAIRSMAEILAEITPVRQ